MKTSPPRRAPGAVSLLLVMLFYLSTHAVIDRLGPDPASWESSRQQAPGEMQQVLRPHPAFPPPPAKAPARATVPAAYADSHSPVAASRG